MDRTERDKLLPLTSIPDKNKSWYRSGNYMSNGAFEELSKELTLQSHISPQLLQRSASTSMLNPNCIDSSSRRALYGSLPFTAMFGMSKREEELRRVLSRASSSALSLESIGPDVEVVPGAHAGDTARVDTAAAGTTVALTTPLLLAVIVAVSSQFLVGFNTSVLNGAEHVVFPDSPITLWSVVVASFAVGGPFGAILGGVLANRHGRRGAMLINAWIFLAGRARNLYPQTNTQTSPSSPLPHLLTVFTIFTT
jgi:hypothetical protein